MMSVLDNRMRFLLPTVAVLICAAAIPAYSETNFETIRFIQYLEEGTALEEVRQGNIDMYYWRVPSDRLSDSAAREGITIHESAGSSYDILLNPAPGDVFNPFTLKDIRFALNYLIDRNLIVNELMDGYGAPLMAWYGSYSPEYISIIDLLESYNFEHNPQLALEMINTAMTDAGGTLQDGVWMVDQTPVELRFFIRSDDPIRKAIGEVLAADLEDAGFIVHRDFGDLNKAFTTVYGSDPANLEWHLYTEGWGRSGFERYDSSGLSQMYAPWFSVMPGFGNAAFWNYEHPELDRVTKDIFSGNFSSAEERTDLIREGIMLGVDESVRIFLADRVDQYVVHEDIDGVINDFGAGIPSRFTTINARSDQTTLDIGVKHIYQGSWNPVAGLTDLYSNHIWYALYDPPIFSHPYSGSTIPLRAEWEIQTAGPDGSLSVPSDAILWDVKSDAWVDVGPDTTATSLATFHMTFSNWHHGVGMSMDDVLYGIYFSTEWGTNEGEDDPTVDPQYTPRAAQNLESIKGIRVLDEQTIEVYVDYWHFDEGEIATWASVGAAMPWELFQAMEQAVLDDRTAFSRSVAQSKGVNWLSVLIPGDAKMLREYLVQFRDSGETPSAIPAQDAAARYDAAISWIDEYEHAVISNGPYMMQGYSPESRTITLTEFDDPTYPFATDKWSEFESVTLPEVSDVSIPDLITTDTDLQVAVDTQGADRVLYFVSDAADAIILSGDVDTDSDGAATVSVDTAALGVGPAGFKIFAVSDTVLRPDSYSTNFLITQADVVDITPVEDIPSVEPDVAEESEVWWYAVPIGVGVAAAIIGIAYWRRRS